MTLATPAMLGNSDPLIAGLLGAVGSGKSTTVLELGIIQIGHFSPELEGWAIGQNFWDVFDVDDDIDAYGVCDSVAQLKSKIGDRLESDPRKLCVFVTHIAKDRENAGNGGGWRWHKWGPYVGEGTPTTEYLDDEPGFDDGVFVYHVYVVMATSTHVGER